MTKPRLRAYLALLATAAIWGAATPIIKFTLGGVSALTFLTYRFALSAGLALLSLPFGGLKLPPSPRPRILSFLYGFLVSTVSLGLLFLGLEKTTVLDSTLITMIGPLLILAAGALFFRERITRQERFGIGVALFGTLLTTLEPLLQNGTAISQLKGNLLIILYLIANTAAVVLVKELMRLGVSAVSLTNLSFLIGFLTILPLTVLTSGGANLVSAISSLAPPYHLGVLYMALISGSLAYALWTRAQKTIEVGEAALFSYLYPLFSAPLAIFWLKERVTLTFLAGAIIVAVGVFIAEWKGRPVVSSNRGANRNRE